jgi:hypothetical protein
MKKTRFEIHCAECGVAFFVTPHQYEVKNRRFCNWACKTANSNKNKKRVCEVCNIEFYVKYPSHKPKCCSDICSFKLRTTGEYKACKQCGNPMWVTPATKDVKVFCSMDCCTEWKRITLCGENNFNWKEGISFFPYPVGWNKSLKKQIRERDGNTCKNCGSQSRITVHHIDYVKENISENNLITLCTVCNSKANANRDYWREYYSNLMMEVTNG